VVFHDLDGIRTQAIAKENEIGARPPRTRDDKTIAIEEMRHFRDFLRPWIFLHALDIGKLAVSGRVQAECREILQGGKMHSLR
jgi:hypothetical protein